MPRGENLTPELRSLGGKRGGPARAAKIAEQKRLDAERIEEAWRERLDRMFAGLDAILDNGDDAATQLRAILAGFDRLIGKPLQHTEHSGTIDHQHTAVEAREHIARHLTAVPPRTGANGDSGGADG